MRPGPEILQKTESPKDHKRMWWSWHKTHPWVFARFEQLTLDLISKGFKRYSSDGITHVIRFEHDIQKDPHDQFKINNNYTPYMASYFMYLHPEYKLFFETRIRKATSNEPRAFNQTKTVWSH